MFPLVSLSNNPLSPNFSEYVLILSLLFYNKMLFGPGCQAWILSLTVEAKALTKWHKCKSTDFPAIDVTHPCKDCWKAIFLQNQYYPPPLFVQYKRGYRKMEGEFLWDAQFMKKVFNSLYMPLYVGKCDVFPPWNQKREEQRELLKQIGVLQTTYCPVSQLSWVSLIWTCPSHLFVQKEPGIWR